MRVLLASVTPSEKDSYSSNDAGGIQSGQQVVAISMRSERPDARAESLRFTEENTVSITARRRYSFPANGRRLRTGSESDLMKVPFEHNDYFVRRLMKNEC